MNHPKKRMLISPVLILLVMLFSPATGKAGLPRPPIPPLPPLIVPVPPPVVVVPGTYVYFAPDVDVDLFFFHGYWYRPYGGRWYRASSYSGPWGFVPERRVPHAVIGLPPNYRAFGPGHERIPHEELRRNWRTWENERHWDRGGHEGRGKRGRKHHGEDGEGRGRGHGHGR